MRDSSGNEEQEQLYWILFFSDICCGHDDRIQSGGIHRKEDKETLNKNAIFEKNAFFKKGYM